MPAPAPPPAPAPNPAQRHPAYPQHKELLQRFIRENRLIFRDPFLLFQAFVTRSYANEAEADAPAMDNERLEFLGDAVLAKIVAERLFRAFPGHQEGALTQMRADLVSRQALAAYARDLDLGRYLLLGKSGEQGNMRQNPRVLANTFEAVLGAIQLDQGNLAAERFLQRWLTPAVQALAAQGVTPNPTVTLQHRAQADWGVTPTYECIAAAGPDHDPQFAVQVKIKDRVMGTGRSSSLKGARGQAAKHALATIERASADDPWRDVNRAV